MKYFKIYRYLLLITIFTSFIAVGLLDAQPVTAPQPTRPTILVKPVIKVQQPKATISSRPKITKIGYCCIAGKVSRSSETDCISKRGKFATSQQRAQKLCLSEKGFCCKDGEVTSITRGICDKKEGTFFLKQIDAKKKCVATKGFCCDEGEVTASTKGSCDQNKGNFFIKRNDAQTECNKQNGFCLKDGKIIRNSKGDCIRKKGSFYLKQPLAKRALDQEKGYCCKDANITSLTRKLCQTKKGSFFANRLQAVKACTKMTGALSSKTSMTNKLMGSPKSPLTGHAPKKVQQTTADEIKVNTQILQSSPGTTGNQVQGGPTIGQLKNSKPVTVSGSVTKIKPQKASTTKVQKDLTPKAKLTSDAIPTAIATTQVISASPSTPAPLPSEQEIVGTNLDNIGAVPNSVLGLSGFRPTLKVVYIKDRFVQIGNNIYKSEMMGRLVLKNIAAQFPCGTLAKTTKAEVHINNTHVYDNLALYLNKQDVIMLPELELLNKSKFEADFCQAGQVKVQQHGLTQFNTIKTCENTSGNKTYGDPTNLPMIVFCDMRPDADPDSFDPNASMYLTTPAPTLSGGATGNQQGLEKMGLNSPQAVTDNSKPLVNTTAKETITIDKKKITGGVPAAMTDIAINDFTNPQAVTDGSKPLVDTTVKEPSVTLKMQHTKALYIDNELRFGSPYTSVYNATPTNRLSSNLDVQIDCVHGELIDANYSVMGGEGSNGIQNQLSAAGSGLLNNMPIFTQEQLSTICGNGDFSRDTKQFNFVFDFTCSFPGNTNIQYTKGAQAPMEIICDRRQSVKAEAERFTYKNTCPPGYYIQESGNPTQTYSRFNGPGNPLECVQNGTGTNNQISPEQAGTETLNPPPAD